MLSRFVIEPTAIANEQFGTDVATMKHFLAQLIEFWSSHGVLIYPKSSISTAEWQAVIKTLPVQLRQSFTAVFLDDVPFPECRTVHWKENICLDDASSYKDLIDITGTLGADLALLEPVRAIEYGLGDDEFCACDRFPDLASYTEITRWHLVTHTCKIENLRMLAGKDIKKGDHPKDVWDERLKSYAEHSREIVVGDPYAAYDLSNDKPFRHKNELNKGLLNLIQYIISLKRRKEEKRMPDVRIIVFATYDNGYDANPNNSLASIHEVLNAKLNDMRDPSSRIKEVHVYLAPSNGHLFHDRWLRFDHNAITLGKGVEVFNHVHTVRRINAGDSDFQLKGREGVISTRRDEVKVSTACTGIHEHFSIAIR